MKKQENFTFYDTEFLSAKEKELVVKQFKRFADSLIKNFGKEYTNKYGNTLDLSFRYFTKNIYNYLHLHCGFIAHYDRLGFYTTYFNGDAEKLKIFISHFYDFENRKIESSYIFDGDYNDINTEIGKILKENLTNLLEVFGNYTKERDLSHIKFLLKKHNLQEVQLKWDNIL